MNRRQTSAEQLALPFDSTRFALPALPARTRARLAALRARLAAQTTTSEAPRRGVGLDSQPAACTDAMAEKQ